MGENSSDLRIQACTRCRPTALPWQAHGWHRGDVRNNSAERCIWKEVPRFPGIHSLYTGADNVVLLALQFS